MARYTKEILEKAAENAESVADVCRNLGITTDGGTASHVKARLKYFGVNCEHFLGRKKNLGKKLDYLRKHLEEYLSNRIWISSHNLRLRLINEGIKEERCEECLNREWRGKPIKLHLHHKDGNDRNNALENLQVLCPNCHSYTETFGVKNVRLRSPTAETSVSEAE